MLTFNPLDRRNGAVKRHNPRRRFDWSPDLLGMGRSVASKVEEARKHGLLQLAQSNLAQCPMEIFSLGSIVRLDLSFNHLSCIPDAVGSLVALQMLYVSHNRKLQTLPSALAKCSSLQVVDAQCTALNALPCELSSLKHLRVLDIHGTPLEDRWVKKKHLKLLPSQVQQLHEDAAMASAYWYAAFASESEDMPPTPTPCDQILTKLRRKHERTQLKHDMFERLHDEVYRVERKDLETRSALQRMLQRLLKQFPLADELRGLIRNAERLFPSECSLGVLEQLDGSALRTAYDRLRNENDRKKRAADLEIKIRNLYFDRIDVTTVERMVNDIYAQLPALADVIFLIKHAPAIFPKEAADVNGAEIRTRLRALQAQFAEERAAAVDKVLLAVKAIYSDTEPSNVRQLVDRVAALFKVRNTGNWTGLHGFNMWSLH